MSTVTASAMTSPSVAALMPQNDVTLLHGVTWEQYRAFRDEEANGHLRMHYSDGDLLLMTTGDLHERLSELIGLYLVVWARSRQVPMMAFGRWTLWSDKVQRGLESDNCYYVGDLPDVRGQRRLDLKQDPPPHLAIEVDITTDSELKFAIYRSLHVQEVWVWRGANFDVYVLEENGYVASDSSRLMPEFPVQRAAELIVTHYASDDGTVLDAFLEDV